MEKIEETLKLSPFFAALSQEEKNELVQKLLSRIEDTSSKDNEEENPLNT